MTRPDQSLEPDVVLDVEGLSVEYRTATPVRAVDRVSFRLHRGEVFGVAGESGSGKSTLITALTRLQRPPAEVVGGSVTYHPQVGEPVDLLTASQQTLRRLRWESLAVVFQSAMASLNPVLRLGAQFVDAIRAHRPLSRRQALERAEHLLELVGIPANRIRSYPHELSGGQRQRAAIALALACEPDIIVMDEPTTAVDVVMQQQIVRRLMELRDRFGFAIVFVTHDLSLLVEMADRIMVMYAGRIVELAAAADIYRNPRHPYTRGLRDSFPPLHGPRRELRGVPGSPPDLRALPPGCSFAPRCADRQPRCEAARPELITLGDHETACLLAAGRPVANPGVSVEVR